MSSDNAQPSSGLSAGASSFNPGSPAIDRGMPNRGVNVESASRSTVAMAQGGFMMNGVFITTRGDHISRPHGRRPAQGRSGPGPYPTVQEVGEQSVCGFK